MGGGAKEHARTPDAPAPADDHACDRSPEKSVLERVLAGDAEPPLDNAFHEATVASWTGTHGVLSDGRSVRVAASCLVRPEAGDQVVVWSPDGAVCWVCVVLRRASDATVLSVPGSLSIEASRIGVVGQTVHVSATDFLTNTRNRHAVEDTRTEVSRVRVADVGTDIRRATTATDDVSGTFLQRTGTWISSTTREARLRARSFLFD